MNVNQRLPSNDRDVKPRLGIFGGAFNPIHNGHLQLAATALRQLSLDQLIFVPTGSPPHKSATEFVDANTRISLLKLALRDHPRYSISTFETEHPHTSYTINTVRHLQSTQADDADWFLLLGSDCLTKLPRWVGFEELCQRVHFVCSARPGFCVTRATADLPVPVIKLDMADVPISSTAIRLNCQRQLPVAQQVPVAINNFINHHQLYRSTSEPTPVANT